MSLEELVNFYINIGYEYNDAISTVSQEIILLKISKSPFLNNVTIKGGVVMHHLSNDKRRATKDLDIDFIKYSLSDVSINNFISKLNYSDDGIFNHNLNHVIHYKIYMLFINCKGVYIMLKCSMSL